MDGNQFIDRPVYLTGADPDLFGSRAAAIVRTVDTNSQSLLLEFLPPAKIGENFYAFAVARPRLQRDNLGMLLSNGILGCGVTCVPDDLYNPAEPFDLGWWRGGGAAIADLVLLAQV